MAIATATKPQMPWVAAATELAALVAVEVELPPAADPPALLADADTDDKTELPDALIEETTSDPELETDEATDSIDDASDSTDDATLKLVRSTKERTGGLPCLQ